MTTTPKWLKAFAANLDKKGDVIPPQWQTLKQIAKAMGCAKSHAHTKLVKALEDGSLTWHKFSIPMRNGHLRLTPHYAPPGTPTS